MEDGNVVPRTAGTPQGGVISPLLANLFLHYAFDMWIGRTFPHVPFERYADDAICHCKSAGQGVVGARDPMVPEPDRQLTRGEGATHERRRQSACRRGLQQPASCQSNL